MKIGAPKVIYSSPDKQHSLTLSEIGIGGKDTTMVYQDSIVGSRYHLTAYDIETSFYYDRQKPENLIVQGKYECAAAALAVLLGESLFAVKRAMGRHGWCNDMRGACEKVLRGAARDFGRDLIWTNKKGLIGCLNDLPDCMVTVPSLNYKGSFHGVSWSNGQIVDPNYGREGRNIYGPDWAPWTIGARGISVLTKEPISECLYRQIRGANRLGTADDLRKVILDLAS